MRVFTNGKFLLTTMFLSVVVTIYVFGYHGGITGRTQKKTELVVHVMPIPLHQPFQ